MRYIRRRACFEMRPGFAGPLLSMRVYYVTLTKPRVLTEDTSEGGGEGGEVARIVVEVMIDAQGQIDHLHGLETTLVRRRKRARKWRMLLLSCSMEKVRSLPVKSWSSGMRR